MDDAGCAGPGRIARPLPWLLGALAWLVVLMIGPVVDAFDGHAWLPRLLAAALLSGAAIVAVLSATFPARVSRWAGPAALGVLGVLAVLTSVGFGEPWWNSWVLLAASAAGVLRSPVGLVAVLVATGSGALTAWGSGGSGQDVWVLALTTFLAGGANHVLVRLLVTVGELRQAQRALADRAVIDERERFSRDLHDLLGHTLSVMVVKAEAVRRLLPHEPSVASEHARDIETIGRQALTEVREAVDGYRRTTIAGELARARVALEAAGIYADLRGPGSGLPRAVDEVLAWVLREGVTNVVRHSGARHCRLRVSADAGHVSLVLGDDGRGGSTPVDGLSRVGGLGGLRQRLATLDGTLSIASDGTGFELVATVPVGTGHRVVASSELASSERR